MITGPPPKFYETRDILRWVGNQTLTRGLNHDLAPGAFALLKTVGRGTSKPTRPCSGSIPAIGDGGEDGSSPRDRGIVVGEPDVRNAHIRFGPGAAGKGHAIACTSPAAFRYPGR